MQATVETLSEFHDRVQQICSDGERVVMTNEQPYQQLGFDTEVNTAVLFGPTGMVLPDAVSEAGLDELLNELVRGHYYIER